MARYASDPEHAAKSDMTPMIDAVFLLIIFFLCIEFRKLESKLPATLPRDRGVQRIAAPVEQLTVAVFVDARGTPVPRQACTAKPYALVGHRVHWRVGAVEVPTSQALVRALERVAADPRYLVREPGRTPRLVPVTVEPRAGVTYGDVAQTVDAVLRAGFEEVGFGGGR